MIARTLALAALFAASSALSSPAPAFPALTLVDEAADADQAACTRLGLGAQQLAAAGLTSQQTSAVLGELRDELEEGARASLTQADNALCVARRSLAELDLVTAGGQGNETQLAARAAAQSSVESCQTTVNGILDSLFAAAIGELSETAQQTLSTMRTNLDRGVPVQYMVRAFEEDGDGWVRLRAALNEERASAASGLDIDAACAALLVEWRSNEAVAAAKANLDSNLTAIQAAWDATFTD